MNRLIPREVSILFILYLLSLNCCSPTPVLDNQQSEYNLTIVYPQLSTELVGGQSFRTTIILKNDKDEPVEGASVEATLWTPDGDEFTTFACSDKNNGRYLADHVALPLKNSQGIWRITLRAEMGDELIANGEGQFVGRNSYSERLQALFGFWIELTDLFDYYVPNAEDPLLKRYTYKNGGYVILANNLTTAQLFNPFVILDVHWRQSELPQDENDAVNYVLNLAGPHGKTLELSPNDLMAEPANFRGWNAWHVTGWWEQRNALGHTEEPAPLDWMIFRCPGSDWLWTILLTTNEMVYLDDLRSIRETFECTDQ
jgi:hypothetical protein